VLYCFPHAVLVMVTALALSDGRLYEAARPSGHRAPRVPHDHAARRALRLISATFLVFTLVVTDFGIPKVIGGQFSVLATDAYKQVVGQQISRWGCRGHDPARTGRTCLCRGSLVQRKQVAMLSARRSPISPGRARARHALRRLLHGDSGLIVATYGVAVWASLIKYWPYNLSLTTANYVLENVEPVAAAIFNSLKMAALASIIGLSLYFLVPTSSKGQGFPSWKDCRAVLGHAAMAVPGLVLGLGYVFFFNASGTRSTFSMHAGHSRHQYGRALLHGRAHHIDDRLEAARRRVRVRFRFAQSSFWRTFRRVTVPICLPCSSISPSISSSMR